MSPRKYEMRQRAAAVEETRRRIVAATMPLHQEQGIAATRWEDIARAAGVGVGTVYRHFPTLDELVPACAAEVAGVLALPDAADVEGVFANLDEPRERLERLVDALAGLYERGAPAINRVRAEPDVHPLVRESRDQVEETVGAIVESALRPLRPSDEDVRVVRGLLDLRTWEALTAAGLDGGAARRALVDLVACRFGRG